MVESNELKDMEPLKSTGDGNCLFNSISILISKREDLASLLRVLSFFYATLNLGRLEQWVRKSCLTFNSIFSLSPFKSDSP